MLRMINDSFIRMFRRRRAVSKVLKHYDATHGKSVPRRQSLCRRYEGFCIVRVSCEKGLSPPYAYFSVTDEGVVRELSLDEVNVKYGPDPWS